METLITMNKKQRDLLTIINGLQEKLEEKNSLIESLEYRLSLALRHRYSRRSEKLADPNQMCLFDEADLPPVDDEETQSSDDAQETIDVPAHKRQKAKRKPLPKNLPRDYREYDLTDEEKICDCGTLKTRIGKDDVEQLDIIPAIMYVIVHRKYKYACKACEGNIAQAKAPRQPIPKSKAAPGLLAHVLVSKFCDHLPLYRQKEVLKRTGIDFSRSTLSQWVLKCGDLFKPLINLMQDDILSHDVSYADETTLQVLKEPGRSSQQKSYMWLFGGGAPERFAWVYQYHPSRNSQVADTFFYDYQGYVHVDGYSGYNCLEYRGITLVGCMAHARRKFFEVSQAAKKKKGLAHHALTVFKKLYAIEAQAKENAFSPEKIKQDRQNIAKPILESFMAWCHEKSTKVPPKSPIGKAIAYTINHRRRLSVYLNDGRLDIDNNRTERAIKPFVIGRKNWLFNNSHKGAMAAANIYSLIETCKVHQLDPYAYLRFLLQRIPLAETLDDLENLLPYRCDKAQVMGELADMRNKMILFSSQCQ